MSNDKLTAVLVGRRIFLVPKEAILGEVQRFTGISTAELKPLVETKEEFDKARDKSSLVRFQDGGYDEFEVLK